MEVIRNLGILANREAVGARGVVERAIAAAEASGASVRLDGETAAWLERPARAASALDFAAECQLFLVFGGDGSFLRAARALEPVATPLLGINMGSLGFLTLLKLEEMEGALRSVLAGQYRVEERMRLAAALARDGEAGRAQLALNDAVIHMNPSNRLVEFQIAVGGQRLGGYRADGLIVATPTGSTAYSLSAGGPIVHPTMDALVATPICPHALSIRPILVGGEEELLITIGRRSGEATLTLDGLSTLTLRSGDAVRIRRAAERPLRLALPLDFSYYALVGAKLGWGSPTGR
ncbi:NAD(+) kinase [bacterium]|nr:NAD(+) kinase [bacterium]